MKKNWPQLVLEYGRAPARGRPVAAAALVSSCFEGYLSQEASIPIQITVAKQGGVITSTKDAAQSAELNYEFIESGLASRDLLLTKCIGRLLRLDWLERATSEQLSALTPSVTYLSAAGNSVPTKQLTTLLEAVGAAPEVVCLGHSSSGKTVASSCLAEQFRKRGVNISWLDLSSPMQTIIGLAHDLISAAPGAAEHLIVVDDLQVNPRAAHQLRQMLDVIGPVLRIQLRILILCWDTAIQLIRDFFPSAYNINFTGEVIVPELVEAYAKDIQGKNDHLISSVRKQCGGDAFIARILCEHVAKNKGLPRKESVAAIAFDKVSRGLNQIDEAIPLLYTLASLSQLEIDCSARYAKNISEAAFSSLFTNNILRQEGDYVSLGHRTLAALVVKHIKEHFPKSVELLHEPHQIALSYLQFSSPTQIAVTLDRLDLGALAREDNDQQGTVFLAKAWDIFQTVARRLLTLSTQDVTWADTTSSATFASIALGQIDAQRQLETISYLRDRWIVPSDGSLPNPSGEPPADFLDLRWTPKIGPVVKLCDYGGYGLGDTPNTIRRNESQTQKTRP